jgi:predicted ABC-type ATPase
MSLFAVNLDSKVVPFAVALHEGLETVEGLKARTKAMCFRIVAKDYNEDEARDEQGRWTSTGSVELYSPNVEENLTFADAQKRLGGADQARFRSIANGIDKQLGLQTKSQNAIGDWKDGAENSVVTYVKPGMDFDTVRYSTVIKGLSANQKAVVAFNVQPGGEDSIYHFHTDGKANDVRNVLDVNGLSFRTLVPVESGTDVVIFDPGRKLQANVEKVAEHYGTQVDQYDGKGEYIGGDTRAEGAKQFKGIIKSYEQSHTQRYVEPKGRRMAALRRAYDEARLQKRQLIILGKYSEEQERVPAGSPEGGQFGAAWAMSRDEYTGGWKPDETDDQRQERRDKEQVWEQKTLAAVSEGKLDPAMAEARGAGLNVSGKVFQPLPDVPLYHVTTAADAVIADGLKSRFELNMGQGTGLGGGDDKSISFAADPKIGGEIRDAMLEAHDVANGKISVQDMLDQAAKGEGTPSPYLTNTVRWGSANLAGSPDWNPGDPYPMGLDALIHGNELSPTKFGGYSEEDMPGWTPRKDSYSWMGGDGKMRYNTFERPMSAEQLRSDTFDFYKTFSAVREDAGGRLNPLFFSSDLKAFAATPKDQIQLLEFKKQPGAMGVSLSAGGLGEWRTYSGKAVKYVGRVTKASLPELVKKFNERFLMEFGKAFVFLPELSKYSEDQARVPAGSPDGGQFTSGEGGVSFDPKSDQKTIEAYKKESGWVPSRSTLHEKIINSDLAGKEPISDPPVATILGGGTASGKSSLFREMSKNPNVVHIDSDDVIKQLPEWEKLRMVDPQNAAPRLYDEAKVVSKDLLGRSVSRNLDLIYNGVGSKPTTLAMVKTLNDEGYKVNVAYVDLPVDTAIERMFSRAANPNDADFGRLVPLELVRSSNQGAAENFMRLKNMNEVSSATLYSNINRPRTLVFTKENGKETIHDQKLWDDFVKKTSGMKKAADNRKYEDEHDIFSEPEDVEDLKRYIEKEKQRLKDKKDKGKEKEAKKVYKSVDPATGEVTHKFGLVQVIIPQDSDVALGLKTIQELIPDSDLMGEGKEDEPHVTVRYGILPGADISKLRDYLASVQPFEVTTGKITAFSPSKNSDWACPLVVEIDSSPTLTKYSEDQARDDHGRFASEDGAPSTDKPVTLVFSGTFNPPHMGHVQAVTDALNHMKDNGYDVKNVVVVPAPQRLVDKKLGDKAYPLDERVELARRTFTTDTVNHPNVTVTGEPSDAADKLEGKLKRTHTADFLQSKYPDTSVVTITGEDSAPGANPPKAPALYSGDKGTSHEGHYYFNAPRATEGGFSSTAIRNAIREGKELPAGTMHPNAVSYLPSLFEHHPGIKKVLKYSEDQARDDHGRFASEGIAIDKVSELNSSHARGPEDKELKGWAETYAHFQNSKDPREQNAYNASILGEHISEELMEQQHWEDEHPGPRGTHVLILKDDKNTIVGALQTYDGKRDEPYTVSYLATNPKIIMGDMAYKGVGTTLMIKAANDAAALGKGVELYALEGAESFYSKLGMARSVTNIGQVKFNWTPEQAASFAKHGMTKFTQDEVRKMIAAAIKEEETTPPLASIPESKKLGKYSEDQARDYHGRFASEDATPEEHDNHLASTPIKTISTLGGGVTDTRMVNFEDGTKGVFKPDSGESKGQRFDIMEGYQSAREAGAWEVAKAVGLTDLVTPAIVRTIDGEKGVVLEWQNGDIARNLTNTKAFDGDDDLARAAAFDYVIGNEDRHPGNWIVQNGKLKLIDHSLSFPDRMSYSSGGNGMFLDMAERRFDPNLEKTPSTYAADYEKAWPKIQERLKAVGLNDQAIGRVQDRITDLGKTDKWGKLTQVWR